MTTQNATFISTNNDLALKLDGMISEAQDVQKSAVAAIKDARNNLEEAKATETYKGACTREKYLGLLQANLSICAEMLRLRRLPIETLDKVSKNAYSLAKFAALAHVLKTKRIATRDERPAGQKIDVGFCEGMIALAMYNFNANDKPLSLKADEEKLRAQMLTATNKRKRHTGTTQANQLCVMLERLGLGERFSADEAGTKKPVLVCNAESGIVKTLMEIYAPVIGAKDRLDVPHNIPADKL